MRIILSMSRKTVILFAAILLLMTMLASPIRYSGRIFIYPIYKRLARANFTRVYADSRSMENDSIRLLYEGRHSDYVKLIADDAETAFERLSTDYKYIPAGKVDIIIYPDYKEMSSIMALGAGSPALGAYYCGTIGILGSDGTLVKKGLVLHELTHYVIDYMTGGNVPAWFTEGAALYEEYRVYEREWASSMKYLDFYSTDELEDNFYGLDEIKAYKESYLVLKYIGENYGMEGIRKIIGEFRTGKSSADAVKTALGTDIDSLFKKALENSDPS